MRLSIVGCLLCLAGYIQGQTEPVRVAVAGISHGHSAWILNRPEKDDIRLVGIFETDQRLVSQTLAKSKLKRELFFDDLGKMLDAVKPEAVVAFGSIYDHLQVVQACAPRGIHVMVEKPLAVSVEHAAIMESLAKKHRIHLLTNYETSWYTSTNKAGELVADSNYTGGLIKAVFHHGHEGPKEIGVSKEFFEWLTDPVKNGGGAVIDFGCYGANIMTWLMKGETPLSVTASLRTFKPGIYPKVDDDATIVVQYKNATAIIQASWNWPFGRKDMELYGKTGYIITLNSSDMRIKRKSDKNEYHRKYSVEEVPVYQDPFTYFADVIRGKIIVKPFDLYSLENNLQVVKVLEAAKESAKSGQTVYFTANP
ncbi:MAG: Gfo/Idh/MocA family oxidoreductase [Chitinophagaceae bacterium]|nr:Gfo/Idh/MocA family oxidoreductase [Chitinophagaceae bacterium]MCW5926390.1 Gfo/Idh/MocA family oxidoreductase [Chitinophagaceae bacterium]